MLVIAKILEVQNGKTQTEKDKCDVSMKSGGSLFSAIMFSNMIDKGINKLAEKALVQVCEVDVDVDVYNGRVSYLLTSDNKFNPIVATRKPTPVSATG